MPSSKPPKYCRQVEKNRADRAIVWIDGKRILLGVYGSEESRRKYSTLVAGGSLDAAPSPAPFEPSSIPTVADVMVVYLKHAKIYYQQDNGKPGREYETTREALGYVRREASTILAHDFGPKLLKQVREEMIQADHSRGYINRQIRRIVRMFKWASGEELLSVTVYQSLAVVEGLKKGRSKAKETKPVGPVDGKTVDATIKHLPAVVADMVRVQRLTGMRSGELTRMRSDDIDRSGPIWIYRPKKHKTEHFGKSRFVVIGPKTQAILLRYLARSPEMHMFRPEDSEAKRRADQESQRKTPLSSGNRRGSNRVDNPKRKAGDAYTVDSYRRAIARACTQAKVSHWSPHRLRHSAATEIRREFGLEHAQVVLGHSHAAITEVYAERDLSKAIEVAKKIG